MLILFFVLFTSTQIEGTKAQDIIYIHPDGSVEGTDRLQLDGAGYTLVGNGEENSNGIDLSNNRGSNPSRPEISNVTKGHRNCKL